MAKHAGMRVLTAEDFIARVPPVPLAAGDIHLWFCGHEPAVDGAVRRILGAYFAVDAGAVSIGRDAHGKPFLAAPADTTLQFNLSHSGGDLIVAVARGQALGVDIERAARARPWLALAERFFSADEYAFLAAQPGPKLEAGFLALWSCKEAVVKALGRGIAFGLDRLTFRWATDGTLAGLEHIAPEGGTAAAWQVMRLVPAPGVVGALAWRGPPRRVLAWRTAHGAAAA
jgi:4'-phosphopantetheinyl transferase